MTMASDGYGRLLAGLQQVTDRDDAHQALVRVDHVQVVQDFGDVGELPQLVEGLPHRHVGLDPHEAVGHDRAGRFAGIPHQLPHAYGVGGIHRRQNRRGVFRGEATEQVGQVIRRHAAEDFRRLMGPQLVDQFGLMVKVELLQ